MPVSKVWNGSTWVTGVMKVWTGSAWADKPKFWNGSFWLDLYVSLTVDMTNEFVSNNTPFGGSCVANLKIDADGSVYQSNATGSYGFASQVWLDAGLNSQVWVSRAITSGTLSTDNIGGGRAAMTSDRIVGVTTSSSKSASVTLSFWDAASGGNLLDTAVVNLSAQYGI